MIVVIGGTGLVGSHLLFELASGKEDIHAICRPESDLGIVKKIFSFYAQNSDELFNRIKWIKGDIMDLMSLENAFTDAEKVYHAAAIVSFAPSQKRKVLANNIYGTANVVNACVSSGVKKLCHVSSVAAIGFPEESLPADESLIWSPGKQRSYYSISKFHSEMEVWRGIEEGLNAVIVNPSIVIGPGNWSKSSASMFSTIYKGLKFYPSGSTGYVDVRDVAKIMVQLMESEISGERFILNSEDKTFKEIFQNIASALGIKAPSIEAKRWMAKIAWRIEWIKSFITRKDPQITRETVASGYNNSSFSSSKIRERLKYRFIPVKQSIEDTAKRFLENLNP